MGGRGGGRVVGGVRVDVIEEWMFLGKFTKKLNGGGVGGWSGEGSDLGGQGGCNRRIEVFGKVHKKLGGGGSGGIGSGGSGWWGGSGWM